MDDSPGRLNIIPDHFQVSTTEKETKERVICELCIDFNRSSSHFWSGRKLQSAAFMLNLFSLRRLSWGSSTNGQEKVELSVVELQHVDVILRSARFSGYLDGQLYLGSLHHLMILMWMIGFLALLSLMDRNWFPFSLPNVTHAFSHVWVFRAPVMIYVSKSANLSPQDSTLLSDIVEVGSLPSLTRESDQTWHSFYILTRQGLRYECSSISEVQVDSWLKVLQTDIKSGSETKAPNGSRDV
ncbi:hypothetical protein NC652_009186 [Populus alba x Populus x berolinensis]|nr:hypothetical protein NC652_009186 [Populus alba x Populus x berolinensis]